MGYARLVVSLARLPFAKPSRIHWSGIVLTIALLLALGTAPAQADGYVISEPTPSSSIMADQRAVLVYAEGHQDLVISIDLDLRPVQQLPDMAWLIPVPSLPEIRVTDDALFDELDRLSAPEIVYESQNQGGFHLGGAAAAPTPSVEVLERKQVGVYDVAVLAGREGGALYDWLNVEGFGVSAALQPVLDDYIAERWVFVAMRIAPDADQSEISSPQPVWLSFDAAQMVYPMRLTGVRNSPLALRLYVLSDHRTTLDGFTTEFAGTVQVDAPDPAMASALNRPFYLTKLFDPEVTPAQMAADFYPSQAPTDEPYRERVVQTTVSSGPAFHPANIATLCGACWVVLAVLLLMVVLAIRLLRRHH